MEAKVRTCMNNLGKQCALCPGSHGTEGFEELGPHPSACDTIAHRELVSIPDLLSGRLLQ